MSTPHHIDLQSGKLIISVRRALYSLDSLLTYGSRQNPKRGYLFISKILGKYVPSLPSAMRESYSILAADIANHSHDSCHTWVVGVAETATGLGAGVAQELKKLGTDNVVFSHTTRYQLSKSIFCAISEAHSHAPAHLIYELAQKDYCSQVDTLVLVDDEISTGKTLNQLTAELLKKTPSLKRVVWASLVNWLSEAEKQNYKNLYPNIEMSFNSLLDGEFDFIENNDFKRTLPKQTATDISCVESRIDTGRVGYSVKEEFDCSFLTVENELLNVKNLDPTIAYNVIGTGEFTYHPFLFAERMQQQGLNVLFQSTGRSPVLCGEGIQSKESVFDEGQNGMFYLYNQPENRENIILYENKEQYLSCPFHKKLTAQVGILSP